MSSDAQRGRVRGPQPQERPRIPGGKMEPGFPRASPEMGRLTASEAVREADSKKNQTMRKSRGPRGQ